MEKLIMILNKIILCINMCTFIIGLPIIAQQAPAMTAEKPKAEAPAQAPATPTNVMIREGFIRIENGSGDLIEGIYMYPEVKDDEYCQNDLEITDEVAPSVANACWRFSLNIGQKITLPVYSHTVGDKKYYARVKLIYHSSSSLILFVTQPNLLHIFELNDRNEGFIISKSLPQGSIIQ